jgi:hypothetical protein
MSGIVHASGELRMARHDWTAIVTDPAQEYLAQSELARFGLQSYLPQIKKRWVATHNGRLLMRRYPLFPRYILLPLTEIRTASIYACRGLRKYHPVLADAEGSPMRIPEAVIATLKEAECVGYFDDVLAKGDKMRITSDVLASIPVFLDKSAGNLVELLTPLLGGARIKTTQAKVARAV